MSIINQKKEIFGDISAKKTILEGFPELKVNPSFSSINNDSNTLNFLTDLLSSLVGVESLKEVTVETLSRNLDGIQDDIKKVLKTELNKIISCDINPSIPQKLLHPDYTANSTGIDLELKKLDFTNIFLMDPTTDSGRLLFKDVDAGVDSKDFNSYLYNTIQSNTRNGWGGTTLGNDILDIKFNENGQINNTINIRVSKYYSNPTNNKKLRDLNNDYINSIELFNPSELLNKIVDNIFGTISNDQNKTKEQLFSEAKINRIIDKIINQEDEFEIDNSYFEFSNDELSELDVMAENQKKGVKVVETTKQFNTGTSIDSLNEVSNKIKDSSSAELPNAIKEAIDKIGSDITENIPSVDKYAVKLDFIQDIVKNLMKVVGGVILSPKITTILALNFEVIYNEKFDDPQDFILKNKVFIKTIFNGIRDTIISVLLTKALKELQELVLASAAASAMEQINDTKTMISSLVGVPFEVLDNINKSIR